ncbi:NucA/NucB deoxyribonuclease domain-containing protein [Nonomuraea bangladeshensis]|uniref:NucA/NucB deoxyribonuclease domain-containing protein n=1 Tax=Nonomuraea bangladeshensis TaxID=404385 RepID=UPI003C2F6C17
MPEKYNKPYRADDLPIGGPNSCDEYSFASAEQGAGTAQGRYSLRALNKVHNSTQGSRMRVWQDEYRVGTGNSFWVLIEP